MILRALFLSCALIALAATPVSAAEKGDDCYAKFYQHKDAQCIATTIKRLNSQGISDESGAINPTLIGFFAQTFATDPDLTSIVLDKTASMKTAPLFIAALHKAGMLSQAQAYAEKSGQQEFYTAMRDKNPTPLAEVTPHNNPADNDYLIGAYMASGDVALIKKILANFTTASPQMAADALRISMVMGKFGPTFSPPGRNSEIMQFACARYECNKDRADLMRLLTLSSAYWALTSLAPSDAGITAALKETFVDNPQLKDTVAAERVAFSNYAVSIALLAAFPDNADAKTTVSGFESLKPAHVLSLPPMVDKN